MEQLVKSRKRIADHGEVYTASREVKAMVDLVDTEARRLDSRFLEPACGTGNFLIEVLRRKLEIGFSNTAGNLEIAKSEITRAIASLYGVDILKDNAAECRSRLLNFTLNTWVEQTSTPPDKSFTGMLKNILDQNIHWGDGLDFSSPGNGRPLTFFSWELDPDNKLCKKAFTIDLHAKQDAENAMFAVIIGNPPYQRSDGGAQASARPLYHRFVQNAIRLAPRFLSLIIPSRWFSGGKGLDAFRHEMLHDRRLRVLVDFQKASHCFPGVEIKGGVCYFLWDSNYRGRCTVTSIDRNENQSTLERNLLEKNRDVFIRYNGAISILNKIQRFGEPGFDSLISTRKPFGLTTGFDQYDQYPGKNKVKIYANKNTGFVDRKLLLKNPEWIDCYKLFVPYAIGSGDSQTDNVKPIIASPGTCCTETYLHFGPFDNLRQAENAKSYIRTKFFHFLLTLRKNTQHATRKAYTFVPIQDFDETWSDSKLYRKYKLSAAEIGFIESMINPAIKPKKEDGTLHQ